MSREISKEDKERIEKWCKIHFEKYGLQSQGVALTSTIHEHLTQVMPLRQQINELGNRFDELKKQYEELKKKDYKRLNINA